MESMETTKLRQYQFSIDIEAIDINEAIFKARKIFGENIYNSEVYWQQITKNLKVKEDTNILRENNLDPL